MAIAFYFFMWFYPLSATTILSLLHMAPAAAADENPHHDAAEEDGTADANEAHQPTG